jgi:tRNA-Thr(GGU) m(6)t(6)A37 methyltransferase TsaA
MDIPPGRERIVHTPIGVIHSPHRRAEETPIQPVYARGVQGAVELFAEYEEGLKDIEGLSHIFLLYAFHAAGAPRLTVCPYLEDTPRGRFATRAPCRPNAIGLSLVRLVGREGRVLRIEDVDVLDGTPLLDIKPYVARFDSRTDVRSGWQDGVDEATAGRRGRRDERAERP